MGISDEITRILRFLSAHGIRTDAHVFQYFESPQGEALIHRRAVQTVTTRVTTRRPSSPGGAYATIDELAAYVQNETVRSFIDSIPEWVESEFGSDADAYVTSPTFPSDGWFRLRLLGKVRMTWYFAKKWMFVWVHEPSAEDASWLKEQLTKPAEVRVNADGVLRFHVAEVPDLNVFKDYTRKLYERAQT